MTLYYILLIIQEIKEKKRLLYALIITDASVKNNTATSISHIHIHNKPVIEILHHATNIMML